MEQVRRVFSPPGNRTSRGSLGEKQPATTTGRGNLANSDSTDFQAKQPILHPPPIPPSTNSIDPSPGHSRAASISHSLAHPQIFVAQDALPVVTHRRGSSFSTPVNPYAPAPMYPVAVQTLIMMIHFGILIVLGILLAELKKLTAEFKTASNNGTGSYLRVALYQGGLGGQNRPFYTYPYGANSSFSTSNAGY